jgi:hypothetical protein
VARNPFRSKVIATDAPFCNRLNELEYLTNSALSGNNIVLIGPRRHGKTSLVKRVQKALELQGVITLFADFNGVGSIDDVAAQLAKAVFEITRKSNPLWKLAFETIKDFRPSAKFEFDQEGSLSVGVDFAQVGKRGLDLLDDTLHAIGQFISKSGSQGNIALDEFQEITTLPDSLKIEGVLRRHIQHQPASYFFIGSRRRLLQAMFTEQHRPFFQSARTLPLGPLPVEEMEVFIVDLFTKGARSCDIVQAAMIVNAIPLAGGCHPYYTSQIAQSLFDMGGKITEAKVNEALELLIGENKSFFEGLLQALTPAQKLLLKSLAKEPTGEVLASHYVARWRIGSVGGIRNSLERLIDLDYVSRDQAGIIRVVDPLFAMWLSRRY